MLVQPEASVGRMRLLGRRKERAERAKANAARSLEIARSRYASLPKVFDEFGVASESDLNAKLFGEGGRGRHAATGALIGHSRVTAADKGSAIAGAVCRAVSDIATTFDDAADMRGIQQFSLYDTQRLRQEDVVKGLFLANRTTIFTPHHFEYHYQLEELPDGGNIEYTDWDISDDFVRELYRYRELVERSALRLLPASVKTDLRTTETVGLLQQMQRTKVLNLGLPIAAVERVVARYRRHEQLVSLPDLHVPWIQRVSLDQVLDIRDDSADELAEFQLAYHEALQQYIENRHETDFRAVSTVISDDLIEPKLRKVDRKYRRTLSTHRSVAAVGAAVAAAPVGAVIVSGGLFNEAVTTLMPTFASGLAGVFGSVAVNRLQFRKAARELDDDAFVVLWKLKRA
jgi:hypothetical protein